MGDRARETVLELIAEPVGLRLCPACATPASPLADTVIADARVATGGTEPRRWHRHCLARARGTGWPG